MLPANVGNGKMDKLRETYADALSHHLPVGTITVTANQSELLLPSNTFNSAAGAERVMCRYSM